MIIGVGLGIALAAGTAHADSTPLGKGVEKVAGDAKKVAGTVVKKKAPAARPKAVRKPAQRPVAKPAKRVVRSSRPQARPHRVAPKPRVRIPAPARKKVVAPVRATINKSRPAKIVKKASDKINKRVAKKIDKPVAKKIDKPVVKKIDRARKTVDKTAATLERPIPTPLPIDPATIRVPAVQLPAVELPSLMVPGIELPAIELPPVKLPTGDLPPIQTPTVPPVAPGLPMAPPVTGSELPGSSPADRPAMPALDRVLTAPIETATPVSAALTPDRTVTTGWAPDILRAVATFVDEIAAATTPTSAGASTALILAAAIGVAASSSAGGTSSGSAGLALLPAAFYNSAVGVGRRFSAALRLSAWRIGYRPAFAPD